MSGFWQGLSILLSIAAALIGMVVGVYVQLSVSAVSDTASEIVPLESELRASDARINDLATQLKDIQNTLSSLSSIPKEDSISIQLQQVVSGVTELKSREDKLEAVILNNPAKALEMPLIERDVDNIKGTQQANFNSMKDSVDRIYDLNKWLLGAMAVGIVMLALSNFLKSVGKG